jgi:hypothetical protein
VSRAFGVGLVPWVLVTFAIGFIPGINLDNAAHLGGLAGGAALGLMFSTALQPGPTRAGHVGLEIGFVAALAAFAWGMVFMLGQVLQCATSGARLLQCVPPALLE